MNSIRVFHVGGMQITEAVCYEGALLWDNWDRVRMLFHELPAVEKWKPESSEPLKDAAPRWYGHKQGCAICKQIRWEVCDEESSEN